MRLICPSDPETSCPLRIDEDRAEATSFLGGRPPAIETSLPPNCRYFATVPITSEPHQRVSIYCDDLEKIMPVRGTLANPGLLFPVVHAPVGRQAKASRWDSELSEHALSVLDPMLDWVEDEGSRVRRAGHKIGGRPFLVREVPSLLAELAAAYANGYSLLVQFDFPSGDDAIVSGSWPFADGVMALFGKDPFGQRDWFWYWDF